MALGSHYEMVAASEKREGGIEMRDFAPKGPREVIGIGGLWSEYFQYLAEYIVEYFAELAEEIQKKKEA